MMNSKQRTILFIAFLIVSHVYAESGRGAQSSKSNFHQRNTPPSITSFTPSTFELGLCPLFPEYYIIKLDVRASDSDGDSLTYRYLVSGGQIVGTGPRVDWDVRKTFGEQKVTVVASDGRGGKSSSTVIVKVLDPISCDFPCPHFSVSCASEIFEAEVGDFVTSISGDWKVTYTWSVTNGRVIAGRRRSAARIRATGMAGEEIIATVNLRGLDPSCDHTASCTTRIVRPLK